MPGNPESTGCPSFNPAVFSFAHLTSADDVFNYDAALQACAAGDRSALQRLYAQEARYLLGVALRIVRQRQVAEDILHDAFVSIWTRAASFDYRRGSGRGWIYSVVRHQALNAIRSSEREVFADEETVEALLHDDVGNFTATGHSTDDTFAAFELNASMGKLHDCLAHLDAAKRSSIVYAYVDGCSHSEIAQRMKAPLGSVKAWIKRGLSALRECMG